MFKRQRHNSRYTQLTGVCSQVSDGVYCTHAEQTVSLSHVKGFSKPHKTPVSDETELN